MWVRSLGREAPLEEARQPTPAFSPGESHGQRSLADYSPWSCEELNVTKHSTVHSKEQVRATSFATRDSHNVPSKKTE